MPLSTKHKELFHHQQLQKFSQQKYFQLQQNQNKSRTTFPYIQICYKALSVTNVVRVRYMNEMLINIFVLSFRVSASIIAAAISVPVVIIVFVGIVIAILYRQKSKFKKEFSYMHDVQKLKHKISLCHFHPFRFYRNMSQDAKMQRN